MKTLFYITMASAILLSSFYKLGILIDFTMNQDFIAEILCINKSRPELACHGKCYLTKQLEKADEQEQKTTSSSKKEEIQPFYYVRIRAFLWPSDRRPFIDHNFLPYKEFIYKSSYISDIFKPPRIA